MFSQASCKRTETSQLFGNRGLPVARQCPYDTSTSAPYADWTSIPSFKSLALPRVPASNLNKASLTKHRIELLLPGAETNDARLDASDISVTSEPVQFCCFIIFGCYYSFFVWRHLVFPLSFLVAFCWHPQVPAARASVSWAAQPIFCLIITRKKLTGTALSLYSSGRIRLSEE